MRIRFNSQLPMQSLVLNFTARSIQAGGVIATPAVAAPMEPVANAPGLYEIDEAFSVGDYFLTIIDDTGNYQTAMFLRVLNDETYNLVDSIDNFDREATPSENATAIDAELKAEFSNVQPKRPDLH